MSSEHQRIEETIAAYALDSIDPATRADVQSELLEHVAGCNSCRQLFRDLREVASDLAVSTDPIAVSEVLEGRVMSAIRGEPKPVAKPAARRSWLGRALLAASLAAVLALGTLNLQVGSRLRDERDRNAKTSQAIALLNDASAVRTALASNGADGSVSLAVAPDGRAVLVGSGLARLAAGRVLELWLIRDGQPVRGAVFTPEDGVAIVSLRIDPATYNAVAITVEKGPRGAIKPTTDQIFSGSLA